MLGRPGNRCPALGRRRPAAGTRVAGVREQAPRGRHPRRSWFVTVSTVPTRQRLIDAASALFRRQGFAATGIKQILAEADAPFSSLYHHFPGGKDELAAKAIADA